MKEIYINTVKADKEDMKALQKAIKKKKDRIQRITFTKSQVRIYTV